MATNEVVLALLHGGRAHGYDLKRDHDTWFADSRPLAFSQIYATLDRLARSGLVEVVETRTSSGPERTVYALTEPGEQRLREWLAEPAGSVVSSADEIVRKTVAALRTGVNPSEFLALRRAAHLRSMRELTAHPREADPIARLARDHVLAHLDADLRWLEVAAERVAAVRATPTPQEAN